MKKIMSACAVVLTMCSTSVLAADIYLKVEGIKGSSQTVKCPEGACEINNLKADTYKISITDSPDAKSGSSGKRDSIEPLQLQAAVKSPRDASSGLATGRRQYQPLIIRKDTQSIGQVVVTEDGSTISIIGVSGASLSSAANQK